MVSDITSTNSATPLLKGPTAKLRQDLKIYSGPSNQENGPTWTLHDPICNRFYRLQWLEYAILSHWNLGNSRAIIDAVAENYGLQVSIIQINEIQSFITINNLAVVNNDPALKTLLRQHQTGKTGFWQWLLHHYLFFKIPLFKPDKFLQLITPRLEFIFSRIFLIILALSGATGIYLTARQWDHFKTTFDYFLTPQGLFFYLIALIFIKIVHELGHGITASRLGCRVPTMGVGFMVLFPILYTDTSEVWKLKSRDSRAAVGMAGVGAELIVAVLATLIWNFMPEGPGRNTVILLATITWITSLAINLNPLMRFDGYYLLADRLGMDNLQERAFALARWQLREWFLGINDPPPEDFSPKRRFILLIYSYATWIYRFLLFLGIALLVYNFLFKLAGIFLMLVELIWFIVRPIYKELREIWMKREKVHLNHNTIATIIVLTSLTLILLIPWQRQITIPAILTAKQQVRLYPPSSSIIKKLHVTKGQSVTKDELLLTLSAPDLEHKIKLVESNINTLKWRIDHASSNRSILEESGVMQKEMATLLTKKAGLDAQKARLRVTAPFAAIVTDIKTGLHPGRWLASTETLITLAASGPPQVHGYISPAQRKRVSTVGTATFQTNDTSQPQIEVKLSTADPIGVPFLDHAYFSTTFGGPIPTWSDKQGRLIPISPIYRLTLETVEPLPNLTFEKPGQLKIQAEGESILKILWQQALQILIRESSF
ncbi:MAG: biotin/lipoyl-binding protein [Magnetococcales bacterium]|nr:biotin/lipoyl-binding protein [Magnetococcales bacterium]